MADNVPITAGTGTNIAADDIGSVWHQRVKVQHGADGSATDVSTASPLPTWSLKDRQRLPTTVTGVTTATTAYVAGDQLGALITIANAARVSGGTGTIRQVAVNLTADITGAIDVVFFRDTITLAGDNLPFNIATDADILKVIEVVQLGTSIDLGGNRIARASGLDISYDCVGGTNLYASLITRVGHTFFAVGDVTTLVCYVERD